MYRAPYGPAIRFDYIAPAPVSPNLPCMCSPYNSTLALSAAGGIPSSIIWIKFPNPSTMIISYTQSPYTIPQVTTIALTEHLGNNSFITAEVVETDFVNLSVGIYQGQWNTDSAVLYTVANITLDFVTVTGSPKITWAAVGPSISNIPHVYSAAHHSCSYDNLGSR